MRARVLVLSALAALSLLAGCGGSGGPGPVAGATVRARVDFTRLAGNAGLTGRSVRLRVFDTDGQQLGSGIVNGTTPVTTNLAVSIEGAGERRVLAELYSSTDASGTLVGTVETLVAGDNPEVALSVGETPVSVRVTPGSTSLRVGTARSFYAAGVGGSGALTFTAPNAFAYEARGNVATVSGAGIATGTAVGSGSILARHTPSGATGSSAITVTANTVTRSKWTVLVFLNAANDLAQFSPLNVNQMEAVAGSSDVRFVVQWKQAASVSSTNSYTPAFEGTRRYLVKSDTTEAIRSDLVSDLGTDVDMGSTGTMREFIEWGQTNYPADRYCVVVWNHGNGWKRSRTTTATRGVSYDDERGTAIDTWELNDALPTTPIDILSWDSSLMQQLEVAYEVRDRAAFVVGSEESPPGEGLPYDRVFGVFRDNPNRSTGELTKAFVDGMLAVPAYASRKITQSSIETSKLGALAQAVDGLGVQLATGRLNDALPGIRSSTQSYSDEGNRVYRDLYDVCLKIEAATDDAPIDAASALVRRRIEEAILHEGHNTKSPNSHGVSIDFSPGNSFAALVTSYRRLSWAADTRWDEFLVNAP